MSQPITIGLCGYMGSGKSTAARELARLLPDAHIVPFAATLKRMCLALGLTEAQVYGGEKGTPCELLGGKTPRHAMQTLGTEWGRGCIDDGIWLRAWRASIPADARFVIVDDVRFENEAGELHTLIQVGRAQEREASSHSSEDLSGLEHTIDAEVMNDGSEQELRAGLRAYLCSNEFVWAGEVLDALLPQVLEGADAGALAWDFRGDTYTHPRGGPFSRTGVADTPSESRARLLELDALDAAYRAVPRVLPPGWVFESGRWIARRGTMCVSSGTEQGLIAAAWDQEIERCE